MKDIYQTQYVFQMKRFGNELIKELTDKEQLILIYCRSGNRSKQATEKLKKLGYNNLIEFGGIIDWKGEIEK